MRHFGARTICAVASVSVGAAFTSHDVIAKNLVGLQDLETFTGSPYDRAVAISNDGEWVVIERSGNLIVVDVKHHKETTTLGETIALGQGMMPQWSPDSENLAFYSHRSGSWQLWIWRIGATKPRQLTEIQNGVDPDPTTRVAGVADLAFLFSWSPDGRQIAFPSRVALPAETETGLNTQASSNKPIENGPLVLTASTPHSLTMSGIGGERTLATGVLEVGPEKAIRFRAATRQDALFNQLFVVDVYASALDQLTSGRRSAFHPAWSPDGSTIVFASIEGSLLDSHVSSGELVLIDPLTKKERVLLSNTRINYQPSWSDDGDRIAYFSIDNLFDRPQIHVVRRKDGHEIAKGPRFDRHIFEFEWLDDEHKFIIGYKDGVSRRIGVIELDSETITDVTANGDRPYSASWLAKTTNGTLIWRQTDPSEGETVQFVESPGDAPRILMRFHEDRKDYCLGRVETFRWRSSQGEAREGTVLFPPSYVPGRLYPLIVDAYPQVGGADWSSPMGGNFAWAARGYIVFRPSGRAPHVWINPWKDLDSSRAAIGPKGWDLAFDDVMSGVDALLDRGAVDPDRMCLFGHSNGGAVVAHLIGETDRFRCAVIVAPAMTNWTRFPLLNPEFEDWITRAAGGKTLEDSVGDYVALSPVFRLGNVNTPVLLAVGDNDRSFLLNAIEIYNRLRANGTSVTLLRYPDQGHVFSGEALQDFWSREIDFFGKHLSPGLLEAK